MLDRCECGHPKQLVSGVYVAVITGHDREGCVTPGCKCLNWYDDKGNHIRYAPTTNIAFQRMDSLLNKKEKLGKKSTMTL